MAAQLTEHWTQSVWDRVAGLLANPPEAVAAPTVGTRTPPRRQVKLTPAQAERLVTDYLAGASIAAVAMKYHVDHNTASRRLARAGVQTRSQRSIPASEIPGFRQLRDKGWTYQQLAQHYGCSTATVRNTLRRDE